MTKRSLTICAVAAIALGFGTAVSADPAVTATAACTGRNNKWVTVTVDAPQDAIVIGYWGEAGPRQTGTRFVPDAGGSNPTGDYDIDIRLELWDIPTIEGHKVLATGSVHTPSCYSPKLATTVPK